MPRGDESQRSAGNQHDGRRDGDHPGVRRVEELGLAHSAVQRMSDPEHVAERIRRRQRHGRRSDDRRVEKEQGEDGARDR